MNVKKHSSLITIVAGTAMLLSTLDTGIINVALPFLKNELHSATSITALTVTGYTLSLAICILPFGYFSDRFGKLRISYLGFILFGLSSILCGIATNISTLIFFRVLQGIGAAALQATSAALITTLVDSKYVNRSLGVLGIMIGLGPVLGPSIGGLFLAVNAWRLIFWINVPFTVIGIICIQFLIRKVSEKRKIISFDWFGSTLSSSMVVLLISGFSLLSNRNNLWKGIVFVILGLINACAFYRIELKQKNPLIDFRSLNKNLISYLFFGETIVFGFASAMIFFLPPFIFQELMHFNVSQTGLLVLGAPTGLVIFSRISGKQNDGNKNEYFSILGLLIIAFSLLCLLIFNLRWPAILVTLLLFIYGVGGGYFQSANIASIMTLSDSQSQGSIGSLQRMAQNVAIASGTAIGSTLISLFPNQLNLSIKLSWGLVLILNVIILLTAWKVVRSIKIA